MNDQCYHILKRGPRKGERCNKNAYFPLFFPCFCKNHGVINNIPISPQDINIFINHVKKYIK